MNERFKFRAWYKPLKIILSDFEFHNTYTTLGTIAKDNNYILMQCTGLKDKNEKLIYEGDIVKLTKNDNPYMNNIIGIVRYTQKEAIFYIDIFKSSAWYEFNEVEKKGLTIIGNIYENKELLEEQNNGK